MWTLPCRWLESASRDHGHCGTEVEQTSFVERGGRGGQGEAEALRTPIQRSGGLCLSYGRGVDSAVYLFSECVSVYGEGVRDSWSLGGNLC
jgi:hypothetical protein